MIPLLTLTIGLLLGFYGRVMYDKLNTMYQDYQELEEAKKAGVVRPTKVRATRNQPIDLTSDTGSIKRMTPAELENERQIERDRVMGGQK